MPNIKFHTEAITIKLRTTCKAYSPCVVLMFIISACTINSQKKGFITASTSDSIKQIQLSDGLVAILNVKSSIEYNIDSREATFTGEAYFKVNRKNRGTFTLKMDTISIECDSAEFNIHKLEHKSVPGATMVKLVSGEITAISPHWQHYYHNNEVVEITDHYFIPYQPDYTNEPVTWIKGYYDCIFMRVGYFGELMARIFHVTLVVDTGFVPEDITVWHLSTSIPLSKQLSVLEEANDIRFTLRNDTLRFHKK